MEESYKYTFTADKLDAKRDKAFILEEYKEDIIEPTNTSSEVEIEIENNDDKEEADPDDLDFGNRDQELEGEEESS
ncbi:25368_t:CDS:2 [Gigaspora rosea]|nr:25368_t:CDS:2 [Gigaspora rosea]